MWINYSFEQLALCRLLPLPLPRLSYIMSFVLFCFFIIINNFRQSKNKNKQTLVYVHRYWCMFTFLEGPIIISKIKTK